VVDGRVALEGKQLGDANGARRADARQIVAHQIDDHQVLGAVLGAFRERLAESGIVLRPDAARPRSLDWPRLHVSRRVGPQKALGGCAQHERLGKIEICRERGTVAHPQAAIQIPRRLIERHVESL
jgi:hypothetical protein